VAAVKGAVSLDRGEQCGRLGRAGKRGGRPVAVGGVRVMATRGHADMPGLVTAGRAVRLERAAGLNVERGLGFVIPGAAHS
jgi:hypothetical protein